MPVVYLTGAPATGKSTLGRNLRTLIPQLLFFSYSEELRKLVATYEGEKLTEEKIRAESSTVVTEAHVQRLDDMLVKAVQSERATRSIVIDSHPVTKEWYGFRVTSFSIDQLRAISPDYIVCLYASGEVIAARIDADAMGRPKPAAFEIDLHTFTQCQVAVQYGVLVGRPVYLFNSAMPRADLAEAVAKKTRLVA